MKPRCSALPRRLATRFGRIGRIDRRAQVIVRTCSGPTRRRRFGFRRCALRSDRQARTRRCSLRAPVGSTCAPTPRSSARSGRTHTDIHRSSERRMSRIYVLMAAAWTVPPCRLLLRRPINKRLPPLYKEQIQPISPLLAASLLQQPRTAEGKARATLSSRLRKKGRYSARELRSIVARVVSLAVGMGVARRQLSDVAMS